MAIKLLHTRFGSPEFKDIVGEAVDSIHATIHWQICFGPSPISIGYVKITDTTTAASISFWPRGDGIKVQALDANSDEDEELAPKVSLANSDGRSINGEAYRDGQQLIRCGWAWDGGNFREPVARTYHLSADKWTVRDTNKTDGEEAVKGPNFAKTHGKIDPTKMIVTLRTPGGLSRSHGGAWLHKTEVWRILNDKVKVASSFIVQNPYAALETLSGFVFAKDHSHFSSEVPARWRKSLWNLLSQKDLHVFVDDAGGESDCRRFALIKGEPGPKNDLLVVHFSKINSHWVIDKVTSEPSDQKSEK